MRFFSPLPLRRLVARALPFARLVGGLFFMVHSGFAADEIAGPRSAAWQRVDKALEEGKPKSALEALGGIEQGAVADKAWAEAARAIATRILAETGDRPEDDPERLVRLAAASPAAPAETQAVLKAIQANWTWGFFQSNRWRFAQRTPGATPAAQADLASIASWDLPQVVAEIRARFTSALATPAATQKLPVAEWSPLLTAGTMSDAYRPTLWDVLVHDALAFATTGERGLADPEDLFELSPESPALGTPEDFCAWNPAADSTVTDTDSPLLDFWPPILSASSGRRRPCPPATLPRHSATARQRLWRPFSPGRPTMKRPHLPAPIWPIWNAARGIPKLWCGPMRWPLPRWPPIHRALARSSAKICWRRLRPRAWRWKRSAPGASLGR